MPFGCRFLRKREAAFYEVFACFRLNAEQDLKHVFYKAIIHGYPEAG